MNSVHFTKFYFTYKCPCVLFFYIYLKYIEMPTILSAVQEQLQTPYQLEKEQIAIVKGFRRSLAKNQPQKIS